jgi:hypothetical protein
MRDLLFRRTMLRRFRRRVTVLTREAAQAAEARALVAGGEQHGAAREGAHAVPPDATSGSLSALRGSGEGAMQRACASC